MSIHVQQVAGTLVQDVGSGLIQSVDYYIWSDSGPTSNITNYFPIEGKSYHNRDSQWGEHLVVTSASLRQLIYHEAYIFTVSQAAGYSASGALSQSLKKKSERVLRSFGTTQYHVTPESLGCHRARSEAGAGALASTYPKEVGVVMDITGHIATSSSYVANGATATLPGASDSDPATNLMLQTSPTALPLAYANQSIAVPMMTITYWSRKYPASYISTGYSVKGFTGVAAPGWPSRFIPPPSFNTAYAWKCMKETVSDDGGDTNGTWIRITRTFMMAPSVDGTARTWYYPYLGTWTWN